MVRLTLGSNGLPHVDLEIRLPNSSGARLLRLTTALPAGPPDSMTSLHQRVFHVGAVDRETLDAQSHRSNSVWSAGVLPPPAGSPVSPRRPG